MWAETHVLYELILWLPLNAVARFEDDYAHTQPEHPGAAGNYTPPRAVGKNQGHLRERSAATMSIVGWSSCVAHYA
ncbi:MAG: hypothetical protein DHS20C16_29480 [Phycisphaerae bacterium]|nr:MAG: hypothetical protein DHS20C16_29480 [Phycisphaerae bacterium]